MILWFKYNFKFEISEFQKNRIIGYLVNKAENIKFDNLSYQGLFLAIK